MNSRDLINPEKQAASVRWRHIVFTLLRKIATAQQELTADDIWTGLQKYSGAMLIADPRTLGQVFMDASKKQLIQATDRYITSANRRNHGRPVRVWKSLIFKS